jgi:hypothetical protein
MVREPIVANALIVSGGQPLRLDRNPLDYQFPAAG